MICLIHTVNILCMLRYLVLAELLDFSLMLLIPLDAAGSDLPSLPVPFSFHRQLMVVVLVRCAGFRNVSHYFLN